MNRKILVLLFVALGVGPSLIGQSIAHSTVTKEIIKATPRERLYVHVNSTLLFPGEYLLYKIYSISDENENKNISEIANVELISENGEQVFLQKVALEKGTGHADFFVPTSISSGNYKLIAYTNWMRNFNDSIFIQDITVINPYQTHQGQVSEKSDAFFPVKDRGSLESSFNPTLSLSIGKESYQNREKVSLQINRGDIKTISGRYSLSVRKTNNLPVPERITFEELEEDSGKEFRTGSKFLYLPELRGQLITGRIRNVDGASDLQLKDQKIALALPNEELLPTIVATDEQGRFYFNLSKHRQEENLVVEIIGEGKEKFKIDLETPEGVDVSSLTYPKFVLRPEMREEILARSISNQIENAFFRIKPDTVVPLTTVKSFNSSRVVEYELDDYKRFKTIPETFVEIINSAWIRNNRGDRVFEVRGLEKSIDMKQQPLILIDGILIQEHKDLIDFPAQKVKSIGVIREKLFVGPEIYQGAILVKTIEGDFETTYTKPFINKFKLPRPELKKNYFQQTYNDEKEDRIPDFRYQLLWMPDLILHEKESVIELFTSDVDGNFEVILEGFSDDGVPVSIKKTFIVQ